MANKNHIRIGTRGSALALWQTDFISSELLRINPGLRIEKIIIKTTGDIILDSPLSTIGDKGLFTKEIEKAMLDNKIDLAVHSMKDLPTVLADGLTIGLVTQREDVRDVFISHPGKSYKTLDEVKNGGRIATGSLRRKSQLLHYRPDIKTADIRGNLNTRRKKLEESDWDGMLLARAGVTRLGWDELVTEILDLEIMLPAVGQGALAVEIREDDHILASLIQPLEDAATRRAVTAERALLRKLEGGCQVPIGAYARQDKDILRMDAVVGSLDGQRMIRDRIEGAPSNAQALGEKLADMLRKQGADTILAEIRASDENDAQS
ncbi:hydroxymethylbilane synthase [bacterium]|nr:hydroxymethylbilane synthase [bacterium]